MQQPQDPPAELPIWTGRRGIVNTAGCVILGLLCAIGLLKFAERSVIIPACSQYARAHASRYVDFDVVGIKTTTTVVCQLMGNDGKSADVHLKELIPYLTNLLVELAVFLQVTVPLFIVLFAVARVAVYKVGHRTKRAVT